MNSSISRDKIILLSTIVFCLQAVYLVSQNRLDLSDQKVNFSYLDTYSVLWISTNTSLLKCNGKEIEKIDVGSSNNLQEYLVQSDFYEDDEGNIWFTTVNYLNRYTRSTNKFATFQVNPEKQYYRIISRINNDSLLIQVDSTIFLFSLSEELFDEVLEGFQGSYFHLESINSGYEIYATRWNYGKGLLKLTSDNLFQQYQIDTLLRKFETRRIFSVSKQLLITSNKGLFHIDDNMNVNLVESDFIPIFIYSDDNSSIECLSKNGQFKYNLKSKTRGSSSMHNTRIFKQKLDKNICLASDLDGSYIESIARNKFMLTKFESPVFGIQSELDSIYISTLTGNLFKGTESKFKILEGLNLMGKNGFIVYHKNNEISFLGLDKWLLLKNNEIKQIKAEVDFKLVGAFPTSEENTLLIYNDRVDVFDRNYELIASVKFNMAFAKPFYFRDKIFINSSKGISVLRVENSSISLLKNIEIGIAVQQFYNQGDSLILIASNDGVKSLDLNTYLLKSHSLNGKSINSLTIDKNNSIWASTENELYKISSLQKQLKFSNKTGLPKVKFTKNCATSSSDGTLYFGTNKGILYFHPDSIKDIDYNPPMMLISLKVHDHEWADDTLNIEVLDKIDDLEYNQNTLTFDFVAIDYDPQSHPQYSVFLEGYDVDTTLLGDQSKVTYPNLQPGNYRFHYSACTLSGYCRDKFETFDFTISPPYWETWWFRTLSVLAGLGIIGFGIGLYLRNRLREQRFAFEKQQLVLKTELQLQQERNRIADELHDELGGKLSSIKFAGKKVQKATHIDEVKKITARVSEISTELIESMRSIIWAMDTQNDTLSSLQANIRSYASAIGRDNDLKMHFNFGATDEDVIVKGQIRHHLFLTIKELLNNIIKHSSADEVELTITINKNSLKTVISENGKGFTLSETSNYGKGIKSISKRIKAMDSVINYNNGDLMIVSITTPLS